MKIKVSKHKHPLLRFPKRKSNSATRVLLRLCTSPTHWVSPWQETTASKKKTETDCIDIVDFAKIVILTGFQSSFFTHNWDPCQANHATVSRGRQLWNAMWPEDPMHTRTQTPSRVLEKRFPLLSFLSQRKTTLLLFVKFDIVLERQKYMGSILLSGKLPTYPSPKPSFCPKWKVSVKLNVSLGEGYVGSFPEI